MSIAALYEGGERRQDKGHFRNMVLIARADGIITDSERALLDKIGSSIGLSDVEINEMIKNPTSYAINPPTDRTERFEQIVNLIQMAQADGKIQDEEISTIERIAVGIGYKSIDDVDVESILALIIRGEDTEIIIEELL
ncbi:MAG: hypothetical protein MI810_18425 [Flavobacteriales bacterium]|nr:hypothetical protein [Flavobacteriales bacterium]